MFGVGVVLCVITCYTTAEVCINGAIGGVYKFVVFDVCVTNEANAVADATTLREHWDIARTRNKKRKKKLISGQRGVRRSEHKVRSLVRSRRAAADAGVINTVTDCTTAVVFSAECLTKAEKLQRTEKRTIQEPFWRSFWWRGGVQGKAVAHSERSEARQPATCLSVK